MRTTRRPNRQVPDLEPVTRQRSSGKLDRSRDVAILDATVAVLAEAGYEATNMNDIAARAGVGKAAIYRRWSSKAALVSDALVYWRPELFDDEPPDSGSLRGDLDLLVARVACNDDDVVTNELILQVALEAGRDSGLATALEDLLLGRGNRKISAMLQRAMDRGEISSTLDLALIADVLTAMALQRVISGRRVDAPFARQVIDTLILPAVGLG
ncbi:TetR/AcrR family transcriptional regulator [Mycolicibacterium sp. CH28]|uniref:TetR/AcrR family transcriptional regulator n=1 Tax=Mycolicibacterium sp. CH28 TaxID=2512237 RepID=UPI0010822CBC|nr:TetR/AcrR family transcriptional regulator [Mycolicibacterium sp. CH28]TGD86523.1 TetR/AcrR family transcriptional regulator [Mycolicibacterium sp. CH28]